MNNRQLTWPQRGRLWLRLGLRLILTALAVWLVLRFGRPLLSLFAPFLFALAAAALLDPLVKKLQKALGLKPVMTFTDGESKILAKVRGEKAVAAKLVEMCKNGRKTGTPYLMIRGNNAEQSEKLLEACRQELGEEPALSYHIGGVIAINAGPNLIGIIYRD